MHVCVSMYSLVAVSRAPIVIIIAESNAHSWDFLVVITDGCTPENNYAARMNLCNSFSSGSAESSGCIMSTLDLIYFVRNRLLYSASTCEEIV